jgi:CxxC motif-containing protein (DUF1111 family)
MRSSTTKRDIRAAAAKGLLTAFVALIGHAGAGCSPPFGVVDDAAGEGYDITSDSVRNRRRPDPTAVDPGVRGGAADVGGMLLGLTPTQQALFDVGLDTFQAVDDIADGLGPRFNLNSCAGCHAQPAIGGTSPFTNPQVALATFNGSRNTVPSFITVTGPVREARFKRNPNGTSDGGVHNVFVISGRQDPGGGDASGCSIEQPDFEGELARSNVIFRIPTPMFGAGLIEAIPDAAIVANMSHTASQRSSFGIAGHANKISGDANRNGNDATIARFGWKAQNKSLLLFAGEAYNVEQGISNELFFTERDETESCQFASVPNDSTNTEATTPLEVLSDIERFASFARFLAAPQPSPDTPGGESSVSHGRALFTSVGCALCHTPTMPTTADATVAALAGQSVELFSDLLVHGMGPGLADGITQGQAAGDEFRTAPLWGVGQRIFFLHDGRTSDIVQAVVAHRSDSSRLYRASEANKVIDKFLALSESDQQDLVNFLRSL